MSVRRSVRLIETSAGTARVHRAVPTGASTGAAPRPRPRRGRREWRPGTSSRWPRPCCRAGFRVVARRPAVAGGRTPDRPSSRHPRRGVGGGARPAPAPRARSWWAGDPPGPGWPAGRPVEVGAVGVLALAFPLHPPGRPEASRAEELVGRGVTGARHPGGSGSVRDCRRGDRGPGAGSIRVVTVVGGDHSLVRGDLGVALPPGRSTSSEGSWNEAGGTRVGAGVLLIAATDGGLSTLDRTGGAVGLGSFADDR